MSDFLLAKAIDIQDIASSNSCLSASNYATVSIDNPRKKPLRYYLTDASPYSQGIEPGAGGYVKRSSVKFLRNSCVDDDPTPVI